MMSSTTFYSTSHVRGPSTRLVVYLVLPDSQLVELGRAVEADVDLLVLVVELYLDDPEVLEQDRARDSFQCVEVEGDVDAVHVLPNRLQLVAENLPIGSCKAGFLESALVLALTGLLRVGL